MSDEGSEREVFGGLEGVPQPFERREVLGHDQAITSFLNTHKSGRMHHAWLICGPRGIGKATLAFQLARYLFQHPDGQNASETLSAADESDPDYRQIVSGGHPNLLHLAPPWDEKTKKFKTRLTVDEVRKVNQFYGLTAGAGGWRITIVDTADDMNANAANALLKTLEEPPKNSLFFVLSNRPGRLLPTIRSRCRKLTLSPLNQDVISQICTAPDMEIGEADATTIANAAMHSEGSVRRAIEMLRGNGLQFQSIFEKTVQAPRGSTPDWLAIHDLADRLANRTNAADYELFVEMLQNFIGLQVRLGAVGDVGPGGADIETLARWSEVWDKTRETASAAEIYNLDKKQVVLSAFQALTEMRRAV
ncbi:MAG: DNA polymerase III subunit delta' [Pseudomonadota bacterium]